MAEGVFDLVLAFLMVFYPQKTALMIAVLLGAWFVINGLFQLLLIKSYRLLRSSWKMRLVNGIVTLMLGVVIFLHPITGIVSLALLFGVSSCLFGIMLITMAYKWRLHEKKLKDHWEIQNFEKNNNHKWKL